MNEQLIDHWNEIITSNIIIGATICITFLQNQPLWLQAPFALGICLYAGDEIIIEKIFRQTKDTTIRGEKMEDIN